MSWRLLDTVVTAALLTTATGIVVWANCGPGQHFEPDGTIVCGWAPRSSDGSLPPEFYCEDGGECVSDCYPSDCADAAMAAQRIVPVMTSKQLDDLHHVRKTEAYMVIPGPGKTSKVYLMSKVSAQRMSFWGKLFGWKELTATVGAQVGPPYKVRPLPTQGGAK